MDNYNAPSQGGGQIIIRDKDKESYTLLGPPAGSGRSIDYRLSDEFSPCPNDIARTFQVVDFPSASRIYFCDHDYFSQEEDQRFYMEFVTTRKRTTTETVELVYVATYRPSSILEPGLQLVKVYRRGSENVRDSLSFVRITSGTDAPDPAP